MARLLTGLVGMLMSSGASGKSLEGFVAAMFGDLDILPPKENVRLPARSEKVEWLSGTGGTGVLGRGLCCRDEEASSGAGTPIDDGTVEEVLRREDEAVS